jgi:hypothetical protein
MVRNLKDTVVFLHNFRSAAINGMLGNSLGPGLFERFVDVDRCPDTMGSAFLWIHQNTEAVHDIGLGRNGHGGAHKDHRFHAMGEQPGSLVDTMFHGEWLGR